MRRRTIIKMLGMFAVVGCGPLLPPLSETGTDDGGLAVLSTGGTVETSGSGTTPTTGVVLPGSTGGSSTGGAGSSTGSTGEAMSFIIETTDDVPQGVIECDPFAQECPRGEKCTWYAAGGGTSWDATKCVPVMEDPAGVGEECFVVGNGVTGIDNCEVGSFCWDTDAENIGYCVAFCMGSPEAPTCPIGFACSGGRSLSICIQDCDPLAQDCLMSDDVCINNPSGDGFLCVLDASGEEGQAHDPCEYANSCDPGLLCLNTTAAVECDEAASGCCEPFCNVLNPNAVCPGQGQKCNPYYEEGTAPPGQEHIGYCALPM